MNMLRARLERLKGIQSTDSGQSAHKKQTERLNAVHEQLDEKAAAEIERAVRPQQVGYDDKTELAARDVTAAHVEQAESTAPAQQADRVHHDGTATQAKQATHDGSASEATDREALAVAHVEQAEHVSGHNTQENTAAHESCELAAPYVAAASSVAVQEARWSSLLSIAPLRADEPFAAKWQALHVQAAEHEYGSFLIRTLVYGKDAAIGMHRMGEWEQAGTHLNAFYPELSASLDQFLFLDLETTGLGSGTGNVPFMVGLAFWDQEQWVVQQALIRHPAEERAMLAYLHRLTASFTHLVTYNGKSFDWPLLHSRYVLNGMRETIWEPNHIDLLHPSRAIWRNTLESCKLSHIEKMRLGIVRIDDLPGSEAPARYFQFLGSGDPDELAEVFRHNEIDMLSLVTLAIRFGHLLSNQDVRHIVQQPCEPEEMVRTGLWLEKMGLFQYSAELFKLAVHIPLQSSQTLMLLAMRDKKMNETERALAIWQRILEQRGALTKRTHVEAAIELSMYYEHKAKMIEQALYYAQLAHELLTDYAAASSKKDKWKEKELADIHKRLARIKKKCSHSV